MNIISNVLYWISTGLLVPVIVLLIFFFLRALVMIGAFFGQYMQHEKRAVPFYSRVEKLTRENFADFEASLPTASGLLVEQFAKEIAQARGNGARIDLLLSEYEIAASKDLSTAKMLTKMGPILGLMGTLIPMGPALVGLSTGDIASMAYNMQVAFATTVVGLVVSAIGFITQQVKERWAVKNLAMLEYISEIAKEK